MSQNIVLTGEYQNSPFKTTTTPNQSFNNSGTLDMLHSLYDFKATYAKTLSFRTNEYFILHQTNTKHKNWWEVINEAGEMGFIPSNYVETVTVNPSFYLQFLANCLESLKRRATDNVGDRHEIIKRLREIKRQIEELPAEGGDGDDIKPPPFRNSDSSQSSVLTELKSEIEEPIRPVKTNKERVRKSIENIHEEVSSEYCKKSENSPAITDQSVYELVESVRINTQLSYEMSRVAVVTVVQGLHELLPASVFPYLSTILSQVQKSLDVDDVHIDQTHDASRLKIIFNELTSCKEDSQQRSWMLHEDEDVIKEYLLELISILVGWVH